MNTMRTETYYSNRGNKQNLFKRSSKVSNTNYELALQLYYINKTAISELPRLPKNDFRRPVPVKKRSLFQIISEHIGLYRTSLKRIFTRYTPQYS
jgi:site-specific DNA-adenine methylase